MMTNDARCPPQPLIIKLSLFTVSRSKAGWWTLDAQPIWVVIQNLLGLAV
jgi:hypothetical protein